MALKDLLRVEILPDGRRVRLIEPFTVHVEFCNSVVVVPDKFVSDLASIPRFFWRIFPPWGKYSPAAVVHDYLYATGSWSRAYADRAFLELMGRLGVPWWKRRGFYYAVRVFSASHYNRDGGAFVWPTD